jgi:hypothetical protein
MRTCFTYSSLELLYLSHLRLVLRVIAAARRHASLSLFHLA